jgi:hypothetical protein
MGIYFLRASQNRKNKQLSICLQKKKLARKLLEKINSGKKVRIKIW